MTIERPVGFLVVGMHRSGTSALAGALRSAGISLGDRLIEAAPDNVRGFFEDSQAVEMNDEFLNHGGSHCNSPFPFDARPTEADIARTRAVVRRLSASGGVWALKDPRLCRLLPHWLEAIRQEGCRVRIIVPFRDPWAVAQSLRERNGFPIRHGLVLWVRHYLEAFAAMEGIPFDLVSFKHLAENPWATVSGIIAGGGAAIPDTPEARSVVETFIEPGLVHNPGRGELTLEPESFEAYVWEAFLMLGEAAQKPEGPDAVREAFLGFWSKPWPQRALREASIEVALLAEGLAASEKQESTDVVAGVREVLTIAKAREATIANQEVTISSLEEKLEARTVRLQELESYKALLEEALEARKARLEELEAHNSRLGVRLVDRVSRAFPEESRRGRTVRKIVKRVVDR